MLVSFFQFRAGPTFTLELFRVALLAVLQAKGCGEAPLSEPERAPALVFLEVAEFDPVLNPAFGFAQRSGAPPHRHLTVHGVCLVANLVLGRDS